MQRIFKIICAVTVSLVFALSIAPKADAQQQVIIIEPPLVCGEGQVKVNDRFCLDRSAPKPKIDAHIAMYWHPDANDVWAAWNYGYAEAAKYPAETACFLVAGDGCQLAVQGINMSVVVGRSANGTLSFGTDKSLSGARSKLAKFCARDGGACPIIHEFTSTMPKQGYPVPDRYFANSTAVDPAKRRFAAGNVSKYEREGDELWVASGVTNAEGARFMPRSFCSQISSRRKGTYNCTASLSDNATWSVESGYALVFRDSSGKGDTVTGTDRQALERQANATCLERSKKACAAGVMIDSRTPFTGLINFSKLPLWSKGGRPADFDPAASWLEWQMGRPFPMSATDGPSSILGDAGSTYVSRPSAGGGKFSAQAWIKGDSGRWQFTVWSVSGGADGPTASAAVLAECEKDSKEPCVAFSVSENKKIALYTDGGNAVRVTAENYEKDVVTAVNKHCRSQKRNCKIVKVIDSNAPLIERIEVR